MWGGGRELESRAVFSLNIHGWRALEQGSEPPAAPWALQLRLPTAAVCVLPAQIGSDQSPDLPPWIIKASE